MIKFFRNIRKKLAAENKFMAYSRYAIGEIILVVIGILIALQINNWNIKRLNQEKENRYLLEMRNNLKSDILSIQRVLDFNQEKEALIFECFGLLNVNNPISGPEIFGPRIQTLGSYNYFTPNDLGFKNLISSENISLIENDSLRQHLLEYYSFDFEFGTQKRVEEVTRKFVDYILPKITTKERFAIIYNVDLDLPRNDEIKIKNDSQIISHLQLMQVVITFQNDLLNEKKNNIEDLIESVQNELNIKL